MEINGVPVHPLLVHLTVVLLPSSALLALVYVARPAWQDRLRWVLLGLGVATAIVAWLAGWSGEDLLEDRFANVTGDFHEKLEHHEELGNQLGLVAYGFGGIAVLVALLDRRSAALKALLHVLLAIAAIALVVWAFRTGDAGAQAVWGQ